MTLVDVDPSRVDEFLAAQAELSALDKEAGTPWRSIGRTAIFGETYRFVITTPLVNFAGFDRDRSAEPGRAAVIGRLFFGEAPDAWTLVGALVIFGATLYPAHAEVREARALRPSYSRPP